MAPRIGWEMTLAALLLAFALSMIISWIYVITYQGLSYMRSFTQTLSIAGVVAALVMLAIGDDVARGLGLVGALTVIRFRTTLKDTRDLMFAFAALGCGVACGVLSFSVAILGTAIFGAAMLYLSYSSFGSRRLHNAVLRLRTPADPVLQRTLDGLLARHAPGFVLINLRDVGDGAMEYVYHLRLGDPEDKGRLLHDLHAVSGLGGATLLMEDTALEP